MSSTSHHDAAGVGSIPEGRPGTENAFWRQDADFQVELIPPEYRMTIYERVVQSEQRLAKIRGSCVACIFPDGYEGASKIGSGQVPIGTVVDALVSEDSKTMRTYMVISSMWRMTSQRLFLDLWNAPRKARPT